MVKDFRRVLLNFLRVGYVVGIYAEHTGRSVAGFATVRRLWKDFHKRFPRSSPSMRSSLLRCDRELSF